MLPAAARALPLPTRDVADRSAADPPEVDCPIVEAICPSDEPLADPEELPPELELALVEREPDPDDWPALD